MTWNALDTYLFSGVANGAVPAPTSYASPSTGQAWTDVQGGRYSVVSGKLNATTDTIDGSEFKRDFLIAGSATDEINSRILLSVPSGGFGAVFGVHRYQRTGNVGNCYIAGYNGGFNNLSIYTQTGSGNATLSTLATTSFSYTNSHNFTLDTTAVGTNPTTITATLTDVTTGTVIATVTATDSTANLQQIGAIGMDIGNTTGSSAQTNYITQIQSFSYTAPTLTTIPVSSPAFVFSPGNWKGDTGRGGSAYRKSWNNGAYFRLTWTASASPTATLLLPSTSATNKVSYFLNGALTDNVAANANISLAGVIPNAVNTVVVYLRSSAQTSRWNNGTNTVQINGLQIDTASSAGTATPLMPWVLIVGDSITEGILAYNGADSNLCDYSFLVGQALLAAGYDYCVSACGYSGYIVTGDGSGTSGDVPPYYYVSGGVYSQSGSRWNKIDSGVSLLDTNGQISAYGSIGTAPALIWVNYGTNEAGQSVSVSDFQAAATGFLTSARAAAPNAYLMPAIPFGLQYTGQYPTQTYTTALKTAASTYITANPSDTKVSLFDAGTVFAREVQNSFYMNPDNTHPNQLGHALIAPLVATSMLRVLNSATSSAAIHKTGARGGLR